ncbi:hypothetical protein J6590_043804, partial [Homalodisca vitripennis]
YIVKTVMMRYADEDPSGQNTRDLNGREDRSGAVRTSPTINVSQNRSGGGDRADGMSQTIGLSNLIRSNSCEEIVILGNERKRYTNRKRYGT